MAEKFHKMMKKEENGVEYRYRYNMGTENEPNWRILYANALPEYDKNGNRIASGAYVNGHRETK